jgi:hypothetical protein
LYDEKTLRPPFKTINQDVFPTVLACLIFLVPMSIGSQTPSDVTESRRACAQGLGRQAVDRASAMGVQMGLADVCVKALNWTANNGKLLDLYAGVSGEGNARQFVNRVTDNARSSTTPFRASGSPQEMSNNGKLIPSVVFDAGFTRSFLEKTTLPSGSIDMAALKSRTEGCLTENQSLAVCAEVGQIQGALAYQTSSAFSGSSGTPAPKSGQQGPDRAETEVAIDQKFQTWSQSWSWDRYSPKSAHLTSIDCSGQCKASGQFTFTRLGTPHTIPFVAIIQTENGGRYSLGRLCYDDSTTGTSMRDCTN